MSNRYAKLTSIIYENPGIHFNELIRTSGIKNGVLAHYLEKLELNGIIIKHKETKKTRFFSPKISKDDVIIINFLRSSTSKTIILALLDDDNLEFFKFVKICKKSPSTISKNLAKLLSYNIVDVKIKNTRKIFYLKKPKQVLQVLRKHPL